jgi:hypothetical protein
MPGLLPELLVRLLPGLGILRLRLLVLGILRLRRRSLILSLSLRRRAGVEASVSHLTDHGTDVFPGPNLNRKANPPWAVKVNHRVGSCSTALGLQATRVAAALFQIDGHAMNSVLASE